MAESKPIRILYMEDDLNLARLIQNQLERAGYVVDLASDGKEGLAMYAAGSYDMVAVDQNMPIHDGLELIRIMASQGPLLPTIMVTGTGSEKIAVEAMKLGAQDYIVKDIDGGYLDLLPTVIEQVLQQQRLAEEKQRTEEALLRLEMAVEQSIDGIAVADMDGNIQFVNPAWAQMHGYSTTEELLGRHLSIFHTKEQLQEDVIPFNERAMEFGAHQGEVGHARKDGITFPTWMTVTLLKDEKGNPAGLVGTARDITEHKRAEEALRESEERYRSLFEDVPVGIYRTSPEGQVLDVNPALVDMLGYPDRETLLATNAIEGYVNAEDRQRWLAQVERDGITRGYEVQWCRYDGTTIWMRSTDRVVRDAENRVLYYEGAVEDITERKRAEEELRKHQQHLEEMVEERTADLAKANEELQREIIERKRAEEAEREQRALAEALRDTAEVLNSTLAIDKVLDHILASVGRVVPYDAVNIHLLDENAETGRAFRIRGYTERNLGAPVLGKPYRLVDVPIYCQMAASKQPIAIADTQAHPDWVVFPETSWIRSFASAPLCLHGDVIGFLNLDSATPGFFTTTHAKQLQAFANQAAHAIQNARLYEKAQQEIAERKRAEGELKRYRDHLEELVEERTAELVTAVEQLEREITERRRAEEQLQRYTAELEQRNEEVKQFAYIVSHDLRAPLTNLKGFAEELYYDLEVVGSAMDKVLPHLGEEQQQAVTAAFQEDIPEALGFINSSVSRMDRFISALLELSRLGRRELNLEPIDMSALVQATLKTLAHQIEERQVKVTVGSLPEVVADRTSMEQIVGNLLTNAVLYLDPDRPGEIEISGVRSDDETVFYVHDNGRGIAEEDMDKVFAPFRRAGQQDVPGEGMGLPYVQALVRRHGGRISCKSELGVGTTITFTLSNHLVEGRI